MMLTCCTGQCLAAKRAWRECAACRYLRTLRGPMITCSPPNAGETEKPGCQVLELGFQGTFYIPAHFLLHASLSLKYDWSTITEVCSTLREEERIWFNSSS